MHWLVSRCRRSRGETQLFCGDAEELAEQGPVAGADAFDAAFPFGDHVGVDRRVGAVVHPGKVGQLVSELLLSPSRLIPELAKS